MVEVCSLRVLLFEVIADIVYPLPTRLRPPPSFTQLCLRPKIRISSCKRRQPVYIMARVENQTLFTNFFGAHCLPCQLSFQEGCFPSSFTRAIVTPVLKKFGLDCSSPSNYRPTSTTFQKFSLVYSHTSPPPLTSTLHSQPTVKHILQRLH